MAVSLGEVLMKLEDILDALVRDRAEDVHAAFDASLAERVSAASVSRSWAIAVERYGSFVERGAPLVLRDVERDGPVQYHDVPLRFDHGSARLHLTYRDGRIVGFALQTDRS